MCGSMTNNEYYKKINIKFAKIYFFLLISFQLIGIACVVLFIRDVVSLIIIAFILTIALPIILGLILISYFRKYEAKRS